MTFLIVVHVIICVALIGIILLQPGKGDMGIGFGSSSQSIFGSKGAGNFLTKVTTVCAVVFILTSFMITKVRTMRAESSVIQPGTTVEPVETVPAETSTEESAEEEHSEGDGHDH